MAYEDQAGGGFGLRLFKTAEEARKQDVNPRMNGGVVDPYDWGDVSTPVAGATQAAPTLDPYDWGDTAPVPQAKAPEQGDFSRGLSVSGKQLKQTAYGTAALIGDTIGSTGLKEWGLKGYKDAEKEVQAVSKESDSFTSAWEKGEMGKWLSYSSGYLLGQVAEMGAASLAGAAIGSVAAPGAGTAAGAVAGAVEKGAAQAGIKAFVGKMIDKEAAELVAKGVAKDVAAEQATKSVYRTIGATTANTFLNATQELGSIYGDAVQEALDKGEEYSLGKVWLSGIAATAVDSWADSKALGKFMGALGGDKAIKGVAMEALKGGFREGMTEGVQTAIERWGANKDLASQEAFKEYIDSAAVGILGGSVSGGASGAISKLTGPSETKGKPGEDAGTDITTTTSDRSAVNVENLPPISNRELMDTIGNADAVAYLYSVADTQQRKSIEMAVDRAGADFRQNFDAAVGRQDRIDAGAQMLAEAPIQRERLFDAIDAFATTQPPAGKVKVPGTKPLTEQEQLARMDEVDQALAAATVPAGQTAPAASASPVATQPQTLRQQIINKFWASEGLPSDYTVEGEGKYGIISAKGQESQSADVAPRMYTHKALNGLWFSSERDVFDALKMRKMAQTTDDQIMGLSPAAPNTALETKNTVSPDQRNLNNVKLTDQNRSVLETHFEDQVSEARTSGKNKTREVRLEQLRNQMVKVGFTQTEIDRLMNTGSFSEPVAQETKVAPTEVTPDQVNDKVAEAKENLKDSLYNLWDVYSDATGLKKNITGQKYTVSDLPKAIQKVMEDLVKLGYYKLESISEQLMQRMRASKNWSNLADYVTPSMLKVAYNKLQFEQKQTPQELNAVSNKTLNDIIRTKFDTSEPVQKQAAPKAERTAATAAMKGAQAETTIDNGPADRVNADTIELGSEDEGARYRASTKEEGKPIESKRVTPRLAQYIGSKPQKEQKDVRIALGKMSDRELAAFEKGLVESDERAKAKAEEEARGKTEELPLEKPQTDKRLTEFRQKVASILNMNADRGFWTDTLARMNAAIDQIDAALRADRFMEADGKKFEKVDESDENAYLWGEQGFRNSKDLPKDKMLAMRRQLMDDLREMQTKSLKGMAALFEQSLNRIDYELSIARTQAIREGIPMTQVDEIYDPARRVLVDYRNEMKGKNKSKPVPQEFQPKIMDAIQGDLFGKDKAILELVDDVFFGRISDTDALKTATMAMRDGSYTFGDILDTMRRHGVSIPQSFMSVSGQVAMQTRMLDHYKANGMNPMFRQFWLRSMDNVVKAMPGVLEGDTFTDGEKLAYEEWKEVRDSLKARRKLDEVMQYSNDINEAFDGLLFTKYSLSRMQNDASIPARDRAALQDTVGDLPEAWMQDLAFALKTRPDLRQQITDAIAPTEMEQFRQWLNKHEAAVKKDIEVNSVAPYLQQLMGLDAMPQDMFDKYRQDLLRAQMDQRDKILANAKRLNDALRGRNLTEAEMEIFLSDFIDQVKTDEDVLEVNGTLGRGFGADTDESVGDLANTDEGFEFNQKLEMDEDGNPDELRFKAIAKPFFSGVLTAAHVQAHVARIVSKWKSAPAVTVLQNVQMLPEPLRSRVLAKLGDGMSAKGLFDSETGMVYLFADMLAGDADTEFTLFHETYGHLGMRGLFGAKFDSFLENMYRVYPGVRKAADALIDGGTPKLQAIEEVLADVSGANERVSATKQFVGKVIAGLREIGLNRVADWVGQLTNAELMFHLNAARDFAQNGGYKALDGMPSELRFAEARLPYELFSQKGDKTTAYARFNPVTQSWALFRAIGEDIRDKAGYESTVHESYDEVLEAMRKLGKIERRKRSGLFVDDKLPGDMPSLAAVTEPTGVKRWMRDLITKYQNEYKPVFDVVDYLRSKGRITEQMDVKTALMLYERRTGAVIETFRNKYVEPLKLLIDEAGKAGADYGVINTYLLARHAEERNKQIARINGNMPDKGSGMYTEDANKFLEETKGKPYAEALEEIGRLMDKMSRAKLNYQVNTGMITRKAAAAMEATYKHYVNLSGQNDKLDKYDDPSTLAGGSKFNVKGKEARAFGRSDPASDILARTVLGMEAALIRGQKNLVAQRLLAMLEGNYDPNFAVINEIAYKRQIGEDGMVMESEDPNYIQRKDVMVAKVNGIPVTMRFKDTSPGSFAEAIHGMVYPPEASPWINTIGRYNQIVGQMLTTWNPAWVAVNFTRDAQTMFFNAASDGRITKAQAFEMVRLLPSAIKHAYALAFPQSRFAANMNIDPDMRRVYDEMKREGGLTSFLNRKDLEAQVDEIHTLLHERTKLQNIGDKFKAFSNVLEHLTLPMEIAPRLAAYKVVRDNGFSASEAAKFSGEITVNFNMRGSNKEIRKLFLFFNPAIQGSAKMADLIKNNPGRVATYASAFVALGAIANLAGRAFSDDDESGRNALDKVPVYKRATSIVLAADVPGAAIPIPYGWNAFYALGHFMMDSALGVQPVSESAKRVAKSAFEAFTPMGTAGLDSKSTVGMVAKGMAPTAALPALEWLMNENRYGAPIRKEADMFGGAQLPSSEMAFRSVSPISQGIATALNELTGGNKARSGLIDINPAAIDFLISSYLPGFANETYKAASTAVRVSKGEEVKNTPLPLIDRFTAKTPEGFDAGAFRRAKEMTETLYKEYDRYPERRDEIRQEAPGLMRAHAIVASTTQDLRQMRADFAAFERSPRATEAEIVERKNRLMEREKLAYNRAVKAVMEAGPEFRNAVMAGD